MTGSASLLFLNEYVLCSTQGSAFLNEQVLEIGQVGRAGWPEAQNFSFFAHSQQAPAFGDPTTLLEALQRVAQQTTEMKVSTSDMLNCLHMLKPDCDGYRLLSKDAAQSQILKEATRDCIL